MGGDGHGELLGCMVEVAAGLQPFKINNASVSRCGTAREGLGSTSCRDTRDVIGAQLLHLAVRPFGAFVQRSLSGLCALDMNGAVVTKGGSRAVQFSISANSSGGAFPTSLGKTVLKSDPYSFSALNPNTGPTCTSTD